MAGLYAATLKYFRLAISEFLPLLKKLKERNNNQDTQEKLDDLIEAYEDIAKKIDRYKLNLTNPNRRFDGEPDEIEINIPDPLIENLVSLSHRLLAEWKRKLERLEKKNYLTDENREEAYTLRELIWPLEALTKEKSYVLGKYADKGPLIFPGESNSNSRNRPELDQKINNALKQISPHLLEMRRGMWVVLESNALDSGRQAAHSARELIDQILKDGAPKELATRKERAAYIMHQYRGAILSETDVAIIDASWKLIEAENKKMQKLAHSRNSVMYNEVHGSLQAAERILELLFG